MKRKKFRLTFEFCSPAHTAFPLITTLRCLFLATLLWSLPSDAMAQQSVSAPIARELPDAPDITSSGDSSEAAQTSPHSSATISGTVFDVNGAVIVGALVTLSGAVRRELTTGGNGEFNFSGLPASAFVLSVSGPGMGTILIPEIVVRPDDVRAFPRIVLPIAEADTSVRVFADTEEMAQEQVHLELQQRVMGIIPNFYTSYDWNAPRLWPKQKFQLAFRAVTDPVAFIGAGAVAGMEQYSNSFPGYGQGTRGYAKRFGAAYANDAIGRMLGSAILPTVFRQDPRYFYMGSGTIRSRAIYALSAAVICRGDNGRLQPNYSRLLGSFGAGAISNLYYPAGSRGVSLTLFNGLIETAGHAGTNLLREFLLRGLTSNVPSYANGRP